MTLGVRAFVRNAEGQVLLIRHTYTPGWYLPGGGIEKGETAIYSLERELEEEAGIFMKEEPRLFGFYANHKNFPNDHVAVYIVDDWEQGVPTSVGEIAEAGFFAPDQLPEDTTSGTRARILEIVSNHPPARDWV